MGNDKHFSAGLKCGDRMGVPEVRHFLSSGHCGLMAGDRGLPRIPLILQSKDDTTSVAKIARQASCFQRPQSYQLGSDEVIWPPSTAWNKPRDARIERPITRRA